MLAGVGEIITVLEAVTPVADTVCSLELHPAEVRVTVIVECWLCFQLIVVSIAEILSYTAFLVGA